MSKILLYLAVKYNGDWNKIYNAISQKEEFDLKRADELEEIYKDRYISILDPNYPDAFKHVVNPPFVLFYKGNFSLIDIPKKIAIVGTRRVTSYGIKVTKDITKEMVDLGYVIVSGLAKGVDAVAHKTALENNGATIAVVAHGLDIKYPTSNSQLYDDIVNYGGLILSEYPDGVQPEKENFTFRNRIVALLGNGTVVTEAFQKSGTYATVKYALFYNKQVFAVPDRIDSGSITNGLIKEGATPIENGEDVDEGLKF